MASFFLKYIVLMAFVWEWQDAQASRYLPSIIWDKYNKLLTCKCNWMMNIPKLGIYDRFYLVCPEETLVSSMQEHQTQRQRLYYNIFRRKFDTKNYPLEDLKKALNNGSFCDPRHKDTESLHKCHGKRKDDDRDVLDPYKVRIHTEEGVTPGDLVVMFCNEDTGLESDLRSNRTHCSMVFIVNITSTDQTTYESTYGKCGLPSDSNCKDVFKDCPCKDIILRLGGREPTTTAKPTTPPKPTTLPKPTTPPKPTKPPKPTTPPKATTPAKPTMADKSTTVDKTNKPTKTTTVATNTLASGESGGRKSDKKFDVEAFFVGLVIGIIVILVIFIICSVAIVRKRGMPIFVKTVTNRPSMVPIQDKKNHGVCFPNQAFQPTTPTAPPADFSDGDHAYKKPQNNGGPCNGRLPSVEISTTRGNALPPLRNKPPPPKF